MTILAMGTAGRCQVLDFLQDLAVIDPNEANKMWALLERTKDHGPPKNKQKCRFFKEERVFEFKTTGGVRIMAFWDEGKVIICAYAFPKKSQKTPKEQKAKAVALRNEYFTAKETGQLVYDA